MKKKFAISLFLLTGILALGGCRPSEGQAEITPTVMGQSETETTNTVTPGVTQAEEQKVEEPVKQYSKIKIDETTTFQEWESFGTSGAWWSQYIGGWDKPFREGELPVREAIARLLYSKEEGIGLNLYRYNLGAGSKESGKGVYWDPNRRAECFETAPGEYDFTKDANAIWFLNRVKEIAGEDLSVVLFCNSPLERLTVNHMAQMGSTKGPNLLPENYDDFAAYVYDVAEHFVAQGIPVTEISPINEPQWEWKDGQEGCHYEPSEVAAVLKVFVEEIEKREALKGVRVSGPESGEWGGRTQEYIRAIFRDKVLKDYFTTLDCHSYWTNKATKESFARWMQQNYPDVKLRTSEWVEMVNGTDYTMDSAFNMADVIMEDLTILNVTSWQYWVGVAPGNYRDGLIYVNTSRRAYKPAKRLWGYGNFTKFIRSGYVRVAASNPYKDIYNMKSVAFTGTNDEGKEQLVIVMINREEEKTVQLSLNDQSRYATYEVYTTNEQYDLEMTASGEYKEHTPFTIMGESIVTFVLTAR